MAFIPCTLAILIAIVAISIMAGSSSAIGGLRIGVTQSWLPLLQTALNHSSTSAAVDLIDLGTAETRSAYEKIDKTFSSISNLDLHAVIGPYDSALDLVIESLDIPYLCTTPVSRRREQTHTFQVMPEMRWSAQAILDIAQAYTWDKISVFYDDDSGVQVLEQLMTNHTIVVRAWRLPVKARAQHVRNALVQMRKVLVERSVVLCSKENTHLLLEQARDLAMLSTPPYGWLFYDPGNEGKKVFTKYKEIAVNFTVVTLLGFNDSIKAYGHQQLDFALASDALKLVTSSFSMLQATALTTNTTLSDDSVRFQLHRAIANNMESGYTGYLDFDSEGYRSNFSMSLTSVTGNFSYLRGHWHSDPPDLYQSLTLYTLQFPFNRSTPFPLRGRTARVVMIEERPFTMKKRDHMLRRGNDKFEGFSVDLIDDVAKMLGFDYEIYLVNDGKFGSKLPSGEWNGMIGELLAGIWLNFITHVSTSMGERWLIRLGSWLPSQRSGVRIPVRTKSIYHCSSVSAQDSTGSYVS
ncbi:glutamate receptor subunit protein glur9 [Plakobranchus ocellatus]|uniref:Glutamate receptor subunit protein glur9 n=1 Tax=Plakobranchus ocellatus TaxID=259542 RepID=A0AAV3ZSD6_9GAST|nr:glutamate receptor subunit protein glur9 [Plakobranchus ocellatus]